MSATNNETSTITVRLPGSMTAADFTEALGVPLPLEPDQTLAEALLDAGGANRVDGVVTIGGVRLEVAQAVAGRIVSLRFHWSGPQL